MNNHINLAASPTKAMGTNLIIVERNIGDDSFCCFDSERQSLNLAGNDIIDSSSASLTSPNPEFSQISAAFPPRVHFMLSEMKREGLDHIASWQVNGRSFIVTDRKAFEEQIIPNYFQQSKFSSFQRQLNFYGFRRIKTGKEKGGYYHEFFQQGQPCLSFKIQRVNDKKSRRSYHPLNKKTLIDLNTQLLPILPDIDEMKSDIVESDIQSSNSSSRSSPLDLKFVTDSSNDTTSAQKLTASESIMIESRDTMRKFHDKQAKSQLEGIFAQVSSHESLTFSPCQGTQSQCFGLPCINANYKLDTYGLRDLIEIPPWYLKSNVDTMLNSFFTLPQLESREYKRNF